MNIWVYVHFVYGTKNIKIYPFQTGQLLKEPDYNGATPRNKERAEKKPTMLFRLLSRFFPFWSGNWVEHLKSHFLSSSFHLVFLSKEADTSYWPNKDQYLPTWKTFLSCYFPPCTELPDSLFPSLNSVFNAIPKQIKKGYNHFLYSFPAYKKHCLIHL